MASNDQSNQNDQMLIRMCQKIQLKAVSKIERTIARSAIGRKIEKSGRMEVPEEDEHKYLSSLKSPSKRKDLDLLTEPEDIKYFPTLCVIASKMAYKNNLFIKDVLQKQWNNPPFQYNLQITQMHLLYAKDFWNVYQQKHSTKAFMLQYPNPNPDMIVVVFRGTKPLDVHALSTDVNIFGCKFGQGTKRVHCGFMRALGLQKDDEWPRNVDRDDNCPLAYYTIREKLREIFGANPQTKFILTGHSLGGALAILFLAVLLLHEESDIVKRLKAVYTFGQPMVGNQEFAAFMTRKLEEYRIRYFRFVFSKDLIPRVPTCSGTFEYKHFGPWLCYDTNYKGQISDEDPLRDYFSYKRVKAAIENWRLSKLRSYITDHGVRQYITAIREGDTTILQEFEVDQD